MTDHNEEVFPERINVIKVVSYDVESIRQNIISDNRGSDGELKITMEDIMEMVENFAKDDLSCGWGHEADIGDLIFQDENGNDLT